MQKDIWKIIAGIAIGVCAVYVVWFYQVTKMTIADHANIQKAADIYNALVKASQQQATQPPAK